MSSNSESNKQDPSPSLASVVERNIQCLLARKQEKEKSRTFQEQLTDAITHFTGSLFFVYLHLFIVSFWIIANLKWVPFPKFDPAYMILAMSASIEAIFLATFVLITQNRMTAHADQRADLDLQISLLAEHEITRILGLVSAMAERQGVDESHNPELHELKQDVRPEHLLDKMEEAQQQSDQVQDGNP